VNHRYAFEFNRSIWEALYSTTKFVASGLQILCYVRFHLERHLVSYDEERLPDETKSDGRTNALAMTSQRSAVKYYWL